MKCRNNGGDFVIVDKNGKIGKRINIIDLAVLVVLIVAIAGISMRFVTAPSKNARNSVKFSYVIKIEGVRDFSVDALKKKGKVIDIKQKNVIGEITDVASKPKEEFCFNSEGKLVRAEVPDRYTAEVTILSEGRESETGYYLANNTVLSVGSELTIATKYANSSGKVISIEKVE